MRKLNKIEKVIVFLITLPIIALSLTLALPFIYISMIIKIYDVIFKDIKIK